MELKVKGKFVISSKVKFFQTPSCHILERINENYDKNFFLAIIMQKRFIGHQSYVLLCIKMTSFPPSEGSARSPLAPSALSIDNRISAIVSALE